MVPPNAKGVWLVEPGAGGVGRLAGTRPSFGLDRLGLGLDGLRVVGFAGAGLRS